MASMSSSNKDEIAYCTIDFAVHSALELRELISAISAIDGVEEVKQNL